MAKKKASKKRNKQDATLINVKAAKKRNDTLAVRVAKLEDRIKILEERADEKKFTTPVRHKAAQEEEHTCQYCGAATTAPDTGCWKNPYKQTQYRRAKLNLAIPLVAKETGLSATTIVCTERGENTGNDTLKKLIAYYNKKEKK